MSPATPDAPAILARHGAAPGPRTTAGRAGARPRRRWAGCWRAIRDGSGSRELLVVDDAEHPREAARWLATIAAGMRRRGVLGVLTLAEAATERMVATRRVWP